MPEGFFFWGGGHLILGTRVLGPDPAPGLAGIPLSPAQGGAGACQDCHPPPPPPVWGPPWMEGGASPPTMGLSPPPPPRAVPAGCRGGLPSCLAAAAGEQQDLPQGCRGEPSRSTQPVRASTQLCTRTHPGQPWGCSILQVVVGAERAAPHHPQTWGQQAHVGCTGLGVQRERGAATSLGPQGREPAAAVAPPPQPPPQPCSQGLVASLSPVPRGGPRSPWRWWGARGVGRRWPLPVVCGCCRSVGCRGRAARRVREPPCASCRMHHKDHHSPPATPPTPLVTVTSQV